MEFDRTTHPHRRYNPLLDEWVLVSPHRTQRPWLGAEEPAARESRPVHDPTCYLCPGNERAGGHRNPDYAGTFVFANDFPALLSTRPPVQQEREGENRWTKRLFKTEPVAGECRVICFAPQHNLTMATMEPRGLENVVSVWQGQVEELGRKYAWVQVFENHGSAMGASNPHPHCQVWATDYVPTLPEREGANQARASRTTGVPLLLAYLRSELERRERVVLETEHWVWLVPYWASWPFEVLLLPKRHVLWLGGLSNAETRDLAHILKAGLTGYDNLFGVDFPYSMGWDTLPRPLQDKASDSESSWAGKALRFWQLHAHFYPPLLRSATVRKFMVGFEMLAEAQRDITPEQAAARLREVTPKV